MLKSMRGQLALSSINANTSLEGCVVIGVHPRGSAHQHGGGDGGSGVGVDGGGGGGNVAVSLPFVSAGAGAAGAGVDGIVQLSWRVIFSSTPSASK